MKLSPFFPFYFLLFLPLSTSAQRAASDDQRAIPAAAWQGSYGLSVSDVETSTLIFPYDIISVDRGTQHVLTQTLPEVDNIVKVKAASDQMKPTSLTVVSAGGVVYTFRVAYQRHPTILTYNLGALRNGFGSTTAPATESNVPSTVAPYAAPTGYREGDDLAPDRFNPLGLRYGGGVGVSQARIAAVSRYVAITPVRGRTKRDRSIGSELSLDAIAIEQDLYYYRFVLKNNTYVPYDVDFWRLYVVDRKGGKRTARQERELEIISVYTADDTDRVAAGRTSTLVVAARKLTLGRGKQLVLELFERGGGRQHRITLNRRYLNYPVPVQLPQAGADDYRAR